MMRLHQSETTLNNPRTTKASPAAAAAAAVSSSTRKTWDRQFRAAAHEVPSGPNPESN